MLSPTLSRPLIDRLIPVPLAALRIALQVVVGVLLLSLLAQVRFELGPVPVTGQTLGVLLVGAAYGASLGSLTLVLYLVLGGLGLGVFTGGASGWAYLSGTTGGYLFGFVLAALLVGYLAQHGWDRRFSTTALAMLLGNIMIYACGLLWLAQFAPNLTTTLQWGLVPFLPGDLLKLFMAAGILPLTWRFLGHQG